MLYFRQLSGGSRGGSGCSLEPLPAPIFKYSIKMKQFGLNETKLYHLHGILKKNEKKISIANPDPFIDNEPPSRNPGSAPAAIF